MSEKKNDCSNEGPLDTVQIRNIEQFKDTLLEYTERIPVDISKFRYFKPSGSTSHNQSASWKRWIFPDALIKMFLFLFLCTVLLAANLFKGELHPTNALAVENATLYKNAIKNYW
uniref:Uncharacterized protein n=1 Tax=Steinernema glaseri TaxID=37863 RepID=A0A1I7ZD32_9BILA